MGKTFSDMTALEQHVNRTRMRHGFPADWTEDIGARHLRGREGEVVHAAILEHVNKTMRARQTAEANEHALGRTLERLGLGKDKR